MKKIWKWILSLLKIKTVRYLLTGGILFVIDFIVFYILKKPLKVDIRIAQFISRSVGAAVGFIGHKFFVFENKDTRLISLSMQGVLYIALVVFNIFASGYLIYFLNKVVKIEGLVILKVLTEIVMVTETYLVLHLIFYKKKEKRAENGSMEKKG